VVQNNYFPKAGLEEQVYETRLNASSVLAKLGLVVGQVLKQRSAPSSYPYVIWSAQYVDEAARDADSAALGNSSLFLSIEAHMETLLEMLERTTWYTES